MQTHHHQPFPARGSRPNLLSRSFSFLLAAPLAACSAAPDPDGAVTASPAALVAPAPRGGADFAISPELALDAPVLGPAPGFHPAAAFDGAQHLVAWVDLRTQRAIVYGARVAADGTVLDPYGIRILDDPAPPFTGYQDRVDVGFDGVNFLVVGSLDGEIRGARVSPAGVVLDPGGFAISSGDQDQVGPRLSFGGSSFLVAWADLSPGANGVRWARVTPAGQVLDPGELLDPSSPPCLYSSPSVDIAFNGSNHFLTWVGWKDGGDARVYAARINPQGAMLDPAGIPVSPFLQAHGCSSHRVGVTFDGENHVVAWSDRDAADEMITVQAARVTPAGLVLDPAGVPLDTMFGESSHIDQIRAAWNGTRTVIAWSEGSSSSGGEVAMPVRVMELDPTGAAITPLTPELDRGLGVELSSTDAGPLVSWSYIAPFINSPLESGRVMGARLSKDGAALDDQPLTLATHASAEEVRAAASDGQSFFVVWRDHRAPNLDGRGLYGARVSATGEVLDAEAIPITDAPADAVSVAYDGLNYVVVWSRWHHEAQNPLRAVRVSPQGDVINPVPIELPICSAHPTFLVPAVASDGAGSLIVANGCDQEDNALAAVHLSQQGIPGPAVGLHSAADESYLHDPRLAWDGGSYLAVWQRDEELRGLRLSAAGAPLDEFVIAPQSSFDWLGNPVIAFGGGVHLVLWVDQSGLFGTRVDPEGQVLDAQPFLVAPLQQNDVSYAESCKLPWSGGACPAVAFDGESFVVAWRSTSGAGDLSAMDLHAVEVSPDGVVAPQSVALSQEPEREGIPALAANSSGQMLAAYSRFVPDAPYSARRAMARLLGDLGGVGGAGGAGGSGGAAGSGGAGSTGAGGQPGDDSDDDSGCGACAAGSSKHPAGAPVLLALSLGALVALRRRAGARSAR